MSDKLTSSGSFDTFFASLQSFYTTRERLAAEATEARSSEAAVVIAALEDPNDVLLDFPPEEAFNSEEENIAHLSPATTPSREKCDMEYSTQKLVAQIEYSTAELSTSKDTIRSSREHLETGAKDEDNLVSITQQSPVLTSPFLQFKWAKQPFTSGPPNLVNMSSSQSSRQGRPSPSDEPRTASYASVTSVSLPLEESKWAINKLAGRRGAVKTTNEGRAISSSSKGKASSGLSFTGTDSGGHIQEKRRHRYSREDLMAFSKYRNPPPNIFRIVTTICGVHTTTKPDDNAAAQVSASKATNYRGASATSQRDSNRNRCLSAPNDGRSFKTESASTVAVRPLPSPPKPSPNVQESRTSDSGGLG